MAKRGDVVRTALELTVELKLKIATQAVTVFGGRSALANADPNYKALRGGKLTKVYRVENLVITRDVGVFTFRSGSFSFLPPVLGRVTTGVFVGNGNFQMKPAFSLAAVQLRRRAGDDAIDEDFSSVVIYESDVVALMLASVGLYAVIAHSVHQRTQEIGIRIAVGATARDVLLLVFTQGMLPAGIGMAIGLLASFAISRLLNAQLVNVSPTDPMAYAVTTAALVSATVLGCWIPARRATHIDAMAALRTE